MRAVVPSLLSSAVLVFSFALPVACGSTGTSADVAPPPPEPVQPEFPPTAIVLPVFGPAPDTTDEDLARWTGWIEERFFDDALSDERRQVLEERLGEPHPLELTPAILNTLTGLDMADADDVRRGNDAVDWWWRAQAGLTQVHLDVSRGSMTPNAVYNRQRAAQAWAKWWERKTEDPDVYARLKARVDELLAQHAERGISLKRGSTRR